MLKRKEQGISTLVTSVLVLAVVITLVGVVAAWSTGYLDVILGRSGVIINVENIEFYESTYTKFRKVYATIQNTGSSETDIKAVFIDDEAQDWSMIVDGEEKISIKPGEIGEIDIKLRWEDGTNYNIKISTSGYVQATTRVTSPSG